MTNATEPTAPCHEKEPLPVDTMSRGLQPTVQEVHPASCWVGTSLTDTLPSGSHWVTAVLARVRKAGAGAPGSSTEAIMHAIPVCHPCLPQKDPGSEHAEKPVRTTGRGIVAVKSLSSQLLAYHRGLGGQRGQGLCSGAHGGVKRTRI